MLVISAQDQRGGAGHGVHGFQRGIHVGALAVVEVFHPIQHPDAFDPVLHAFEGSQAVADNRDLNAHGRRGADRSQGVLQVVGARNSDFRGFTDGSFFPAQPQDHVFPADKGAFPNFLFPAEFHNPAANRPAQPLKPRVVGIENRPVLRRLFPEHAHLHGRIDLHGAVAVQMILRDIGNQSHPGAEGVGRFHLEAGHLADHHILLPGGHRRQGIGVPDIAHHMGHFPRIAENLSQEGNRGGLAVGARYGHQRSPAELESQLQFPRNIDSHFLRPQNERRRIGNTGADNQRVLPFQQLLRRASEPPLQLQPLQNGQAVSELFLCFAVVDRNLRAMRPQQLGRRHAAARHAYNQNLFAFVIHLYPPAPFTTNSAPRSCSGCW